MAARQNMVISPLHETWKKKEGVSFGGHTRKLSSASFIRQRGSFPFKKKNRADERLDGLPRRLTQATLGFLEPANHGWGFSSSEEVFNFIFVFVFDPIDRRERTIYDHFMSLRTGSSEQRGKMPSVGVKPGVKRVEKKNTHQS